MLLLSLSFAFQLPRPFLLPSQEHGLTLVRCLGECIKFLH